MTTSFLRVPFPAESHRVSWLKETRKLKRNYFICTQSIYSIFNNNGQAHWWCHHSKCGNQSLRRRIYQKVYLHMFLPRPVPNFVFISLFQSTPFRSGLAWAHYHFLAGTRKTRPHGPLPRGSLYPNVVTVNTVIRQGQKQQYSLFISLLFLNPYSMYPKVLRL